MSVRSSYTRMLTVIAVAVGVFGNSAHRVEAAPQITFDAISLFRNVDLTLDGGASIKTFDAGVIAAKLTGAASSGYPDPFNFDAYCVDIATPLVTSTSNNVTITPINGSSSATYKALGWLYENKAASVTNADQAAGLQLAIWNVLYDTDYDVSAGLFQLDYADDGAGGDGTTTIKGYANGFLSELSSSSKFGVATLFDSGKVNQNVIGPNASAPIPELSTGILFGMCCLGMGGIMVRQRKISLRS